VIRRRNQSSPKCKLADDESDDRGDDAERTEHDQLTVKGFPARHVPQRLKGKNTSNRQNAQRYKYHFLFPCDFDFHHTYS
jgi:hypothetical protein